MLKRSPASALFILVATMGFLRFHPLLFLLFLQGAAPTQYRFTFPEPEHRWMQVEATFSELDASPLELRVSRSSPGRYSTHDFAKNVYDVHAFGADGREVTATRPDPSGWSVGGHGGSVTVKYKVYGDRLDGTYLAIDATHAHVNMPAAIMWARGLDDRPATIVFTPPTAARWQVATQLHPGATPFEFTAPNLQYLMDSPAEFGPFVMRQFSVGSSTFRLALHHTGSDRDADSFVGDVEKVVREEGAVYGEFPAYEPKQYTFLMDSLPYASEDGMEHRNSTVITSTATIAGGRLQLLDSIAHEFFHGWNVERIRPRSLEPFDLDRPGISSELWLAEGFTQYYGPLVLQRAGFFDLGSTAQTLTGLVDTAPDDYGRSLRSVEDMSRMAAFTDRSRPGDRTNWSISVISYYQSGGAIALALDLILRERSNGRLMLDDFMRELWRRYGKPTPAREGYVDRPYTASDVEATLADVSGDRGFARDFFARYIHGHEIADYAQLLRAAGFVVRRANLGRAWLGDVRLGSRGGATRVANLVAPTWPVYTTGLDQDDELQKIDGNRISASGDLDAILRRHRPGDRIQIAFVNRSGAAKTASVTLKEDPHVQVVPVEATGAALTSAQKSFRDAWLGPK